MDKVYFKLYQAVNNAAAAKSLQSYLTLCDLIDSLLPGSPVPGILQARTLEWVAISFSNAWKWKVKVKSLSRVWLLATPWTAAYQAPPSMGFSRQEYWSGVPLPSLESEKVGLKLNIQKTKIMASSLITSWQIDGEIVETVSDFIFWAPKSLQMVIAAMKLKDAYSLEGKLWPT